VFIDLHNDAEPCFTDEAFQERFVAFRNETVGE
jgi:hypothetical protein